MDSNSPKSLVDGDDDFKEFDDGYDENLMGDEEDKRKLAQMTEKEREQELFNRSERRETLKIRFEIERKLRTKAKKRELEKKQSKQVRAKKRLRASEVYSSDDSSEDSDEYTPDTDKSSAMNDIQTTSKSSKMSTRAQALLTSSSSASSASSSGSSSESEQENYDLDRDEDSRHIQDDYQMSLQDLRCLQLKRDRIEQWVYSRFFDETAKDLFVKISVGNHPQTQQHMYKVAQITRIIEGTRVYAINQGKSRTRKQCIVNIGGNNRTFNMSFISNRPFDEDDYAKWRDQINVDGKGMPPRELFIRKKRELQAAINHEHTEEDIAFEVSERSKYKDHPYNFALKKTELMGEKADAEASNDFDRARVIQQKIDELEEKAKQLEKSRSSSTFSAISFVNERNRIKNIEESERVLKESKTVKTEDPFTRRKCTPQIVHYKNNSESKSDDKNGHSELGGNNTNGKPDESNSKSGDAADGGGGGGTKLVDDLFHAHASIDLDIDI